MKWWHLLALVVAGPACVVEVRVVHQLQRPVRCKLLRGEVYAVRCAHEEPERVLQPAPGAEMPPL